jgi:hypothetical protein
MSFKQWYQSKGVLGGLGAVVGMALQIAQSPDVALIAEGSDGMQTAIQALTLASAVLSLYGRATATTQIGKPPADVIKLLLVGLLFLCAPVMAKDFNAKWGRPLNYADSNNTPLPADVFLEYRLYEGSSTTPVAVLPELLNYVISVPDNVCTIRVYTVTAKTTTSAESSRSAPAILINGCGTAAPISLTITPK